MKRREFIAASGAAAGTLSTASSAIAMPVSANLTPAEIGRIAHAIKGGFGAGFALVSAKRTDGQVTAMIEHHRNFFEVSSGDLVDWTVLRATDM